MTADTYPLHAGARRSLIACGVVACLTIFMLPFGIGIFVYVYRARITITDDEMVARGLGSKRLRVGDVDRVGVFLAPVPGGVGGRLARWKLGGDVGVNLCWREAGGKTRSVCVSVFEAGDDIPDRVGRMTGLPLESLTMGVFGLRWP